MSTSVTYTAVLDVKRSTAEHLARLLHDHRIAAGTRRGRRALGCFRQAVLVLRWFTDNARLSQLARDNGLPVSTACRYLHEGLTVLAAGAPDPATALERAKAAGLTHLNLDGTVIRTDRAAAPSPNGADLWWSGKHRHHGGNVQVISTPDGRPRSDPGLTGPPGQGARHHLRPPPRSDRRPQPHSCQLDMPTLVDLGYENADDGFRHPHKKPAGGKLTEAQQTYNKVIRGIHGVCGHANSLLKTTFKALRRVSLDSSRITKTAAEAPSSCSSSSTTAPSERSP